MDLNGKLLKFKDNKKSGNLEGAQYILTYRSDSNMDESARTSYAIISALKREDDLVLELNSSLFYSTDTPGDELIFQCIDTAKKLGLEYRYRKVPSSGTPSFLGKLLSKTSENAHYLIIYIPAESWKNESILSLILPYGARYYMTGKSSGDNNILDTFSNMTDRDKSEYFRLIAFDMGKLGHTGINSTSMKPDEVRKLLNI